MPHLCEGATLTLRFCKRVKFSFLCIPEIMYTFMYNDDKSANLISKRFISTKIIATSTGEKEKGIGLILNERWLEVSVECGKIREAKKIF